MKLVIYTQKGDTQKHSMTVFSHEDHMVSNLEDLEEDLGAGALSQHDTIPKGSPKKGEEVFSKLLECLLAASGTEEEDEDVFVEEVRNLFSTLRELKDSGMEYTQPGLMFAGVLAQMLNSGYRFAETGRLNILQF